MSGAAGDTGSSAEVERLRREDAQARRLAQREFARPLVLEAGAGTGKTATLVARCLAWCLGPGWEAAREALSAVESAQDAAVAARVLDRVVAITFTEAAAAEMADRVDAALAAVEAGSLPKGVDANALPAAGLRRARAGALRGALDHLLVQTIHAWCRRLLAAHPLEAGLHPHLEIDADGALQAGIAREVLEQRLREAYVPPVDPAHVALAQRGVGPREIETELLALLDAGVAAEAFASDPVSSVRVAAVVARLAANLEGVQRAAGDALRRVKRARVALEVAEALDATRALLPAAETTSEGFSALLRALEARWSERSVERLARWGRSDFAGSEREALGGRSERLVEPAGALAAQLQHLRALDLEALAAVRSVLAPLLADFEQALRRRGVLGFPALLSRAAALLRQHPDVAARVRGEIDQLLVDEFQDTDRLQCAIVGALALAGPRSQRPGLFLVGDPKQSIYGWRNADLAAFDGFLARVVEAGGEVQRLSVNHRSVPAILEEVERVIAPVMEREEGLQPAFQTLVPAVCNQRAAGFAAGPHAPIEYWVSAALDPDRRAPGPTRAGEATAVEAQALARDLRALHDERGVAWGEIGVLFRSRGDWDVYLGALREHAVPFAVEGDRSYYRRREIVEAADLVRCVLDPNDHLALLGVLRCAAVGVPDAALIPLWARDLPARVGRLERPDPTALDALGRDVEEVAAALPEDVPGLARVAGWEANLRVAIAAIARLREVFERAPADVFVERLRSELWLEGSEAARFLGAWRAANLDRFFSDLARELAIAPDTQAVVRRLRTAVAEEEPSREEPARDLSPDVVQVLTLHGAKGLDFGHVYLMQLHKGSGTARLAELAVGELEGRLEYRVLGVATPGFDRVRRTRQRVEAAERVRTLYVGMTRAKRRLVLAGLWPDFGRRASDQHAGLLDRGRGAPEGGLAQLASRCLETGDRVDAAHARWVFPALAVSTPVTPAEEPEVAAIDLARVEADAAALRAAAVAAARRMARPLGGAASDEAAHEEVETRAASGAGAQTPRSGSPPAAQRTGPGPASDPERARLVGSALHGALETWDLDADPASELARQCEALEARLRPLTPPARLAEVVEEARIRLRRVAGGACMERLRALRAHLVARELPVLVAPAEDEEPLEFVTGSIDLVYRDPESRRLVVVDYKTDRLPDDAALDARSRAYARQGAVYQRALREALDLDYTPRFELWYLEQGAGTIRAAAGEQSLRSR